MEGIRKVIDHTIIVYDQMGEANIEFIEVQGDVSMMDGVYINSWSDNEEYQKKQEALVMMLYADDGSKLYTGLKKFPVEKVTPKTAVIVAGFIP